MRLKQKRKTMLKPKRSSKRLRILLNTRNSGLKIDEAKTLIDEIKAKGELFDRLVKRDELVGKIEAAATAWTEVQSKNTPLTAEFKLLKERLADIKDEDVTRLKEIHEQVADAEKWDTIKEGKGGKVTDKAFAKFAADATRMKMLKNRSLMRGTFIPSTWLPSQHLPMFQLILQIPLMHIRQSWAFPSQRRPQKF